ncbi:MAG: LLM class flavin-dependent oxidoreductase [Thermomicrobiales bacterium]
MTAPDTAPATAVSPKKPFRLGFFSYVDGRTHDAPAAQTYADTVAAYTRADELGIDVGWFAQHHFNQHGGLPTPFVLFASLAARTRQIGFGTAVLTLPIEDPIHLAESAAVFETLHPDRLHLGFGTGFANDVVLDTFNQPNKNRREVYDAAIATIQHAFDGDVLNAQGDVLYPAAPQLRERLWESPGSVERVIQVGQRGNGLLLSRVAIGTDRDTDEIQRELVDAYVNALPKGVEPRIGLSRTVYPSGDPAVSRRNLEAGVLADRERNAKQGRPQPPRTMDEDFAFYSIHWGTPEMVIESLSQEPLLPEITDLIVQFSPGTQALEETLEGLDLLATRVAPALGWVPANAVAAS